MRTMLTFLKQQFVNWYAFFRAARRCLSFKQRMRQQVGEKGLKNINAEKLLQRFHDEVVEDMTKEGWFKAA